MALLGGAASAQQPLPPPPPPAAADAFPFEVEAAYGDTVFEQPVDVVFAPGEKASAYVVEREGRIAVIRDVTHPKREIFLDLSSRIGTSRADQGLLSVAFHPHFAENGYLYAWYCIYVDHRVRALRLARFQVSKTDPRVADLKTETPLLTQRVARFGHDGCRLLFGPDGYLYVSIGDGDERIAAHRDNIQRIDRDFFGAILRIDVDRRPGSLAPNPHGSVHAGQYAVPPDNPFVGVTRFNGEAVDPREVRTEFWAMGFRNPWRMSFDPTTGALWTADVGELTREEIDVVVRGGNYGWNYREGFIPGPAKTLPAGVEFVDPVWDYGRAQGLSVTGGMVYRGQRLAALRGKYLFADYVFGKVWALEPDGLRRVPDRQVNQIGQAAGVVAFSADPLDGDPLLTSFTTGQILRLVPNPAYRGKPAAH